MQFSVSTGLLGRGTSEAWLRDLSFGPQDLHTYLNQNSSEPNYFQYIRIIHENKKKAVVLLKRHLNTSEIVPVGPCIELLIPS